MKKNIFLIIIGGLVVAFCSCHRLSTNNQPINYAPVSQTKSGSYLAGRVAHIRKDFNNAAKYYSKTIEFDKENNDLLSQVYVIYTSTGDLQNASKYAKKMQDNGAGNSFLTTIIAVDEIKEKKYQQVIKNLSDADTPIYKNFINPLILAWAYAGQNKMDKAIDELSTLKNEPSFAALYHFQLALIYDYFNEAKKTQENFEEIQTTYKKEISFRALQLMANFYIRQGQKQKAIELVTAYQNDELFSPMLTNLLENIKSQDAQTQPIINTPSKGLAESLFSIAATIRSEGQNSDLAHLFASMAIYSNPNYDLAKLLLADIFEEGMMYSQANDIYKTIPNSSDTYDIALMKMARNYSNLKDYPNAQKTLEAMISNGTTDPNVFLNLGDALKRQNKNKEAIEAYNKSFDYIEKISPKDWVLYYSLGVSYDDNNQWKEAQDAFLKALDLSNDHYLVQNYLGYMWFLQEGNIDNAFALIIDAYKQAPNDGNIADSLGFAFYKVGMYDKAIIYLEQAVELEPNNPIIVDHLGDAYYLNGRKIEAGFQWQQSLLLKDNESKDYNPELVRKKIKEGTTNTPLSIKDKDFVFDKIKELEEE